MSNKSNSKVVKELVRKHILECIEDSNDGDNKKNLIDFYNQLMINAKSYNAKMYSIYNVIEYTLRGCYGAFEFTECGMSEFLKSLDLNNNSGKQFSYDEIEKKYYNLISRECLYLFKHNDIEIQYNFYR